MNPPVQKVERRMKFENGSASPVVLHLKPLPSPGGMDVVRVQRTPDGEFHYSRFEELEEALRARGCAFEADVIWGMEQAGYRRVS